ncbi:MAG: TMEM143 family protein [Pseudomonadales bacterium]
MDDTAVERGHFIPFRMADTVRLCLARDGLNEEDEQLFRRVCLLLTRYYHLHFHEKLKTLKECYAPFNPDVDTLPIESCSPRNIKERQKQLVDILSGIVSAANFKIVTQADLDHAFAEESLFNIRLEVDFNDFEQILFYRRGESRRKVEVKTWFGLSSKTVEFTNYDRVLIYVKFKEASFFKDKEIEDLFFTPGTTMIKLFRNIPRADLEMLFPNTLVAMKVRDKIMIGVPAAVSGALVLVTKLGSTLVLVGALLAFWLGASDKPVLIDQAALLALAAGVGALVAYIWKQFSSFKNRKIRFMKTLADSLYFKNLDNNAGVFHRLVDAAEESECKEVLLAYYSLLTSGDGLTATELDSAIEQWLLEYGGNNVDFEVDDAVGKLLKLGLVERVGDKLQAVALDQAITQMEQSCNDLILEDAASQW